MLAPIPVAGGQNDRLEPEIPLNVRMAGEPEGIDGLLMREGEKVEILYRKEKKLRAPVTQGDTVGEICYLVDGEIWRRERLLAEETVRAIDLSWCVRQILERFLMKASMEK